MKIASLFLLLLASAAHASPFAPIQFSGGGGTPLTINILQDIEYTRTLAGTDTDVAIVFAGAGFTSGTLSLVNPVSFTLNLTLNSYSGLGSGFVANDILVGDFYFFGNPAGVSFSEGDTIHLFAGSYTTSAVYAGITPSDGSFYTFVANTAGVKMATGAVIPEASSYALIFSAISIVYVTFKRKKRSISLQS